MTVRPIRDRLIVRRLDEGEQKIGGIIIPDANPMAIKRGIEKAVDAIVASLKAQLKPATVGCDEAGISGVPTVPSLP